MTFTTSKYTYKKLEQQDVIELLAVSMEEDNSQSFAGGQSAEFASLDDPEKLGGLGNDSSVDDGFISVPVGKLASWRSLAS